MNSFSHRDKKHSPFGRIDQLACDLWQDTSRQKKQSFRRIWRACFWLSFLLSLFALGGSLLYLVSTGVGVFGLDNENMWAWDITNFVFWIGIGHAGTLISAVLHLTNQNWRTGISRAAEAMTLIAVICASIYPLFHIGRVWMAWFMAPVSNANAIWPNFRSPLEWDVFAVSVYFFASLAFWYFGMIPDLATMRDRALSRAGNKVNFSVILLGFFSLGWRNSMRHWFHYQKAYLLMAGLLTPLVVSVHSVVSYDFATSILPGWHSTIFPPYFVAGAILGGLAMVILLILPLRKLAGLYGIIPPRHLGSLAKLLLATSLMVGFAYGMEFFTAWSSGNFWEQAAFQLRAFGPYRVEFWAMVGLNVALPQLFWLKKCRESVFWLVVVGIGVTIGMWLERFVIISSTLSRPMLPSCWRDFTPSFVDIALFGGTIGLFITLFLLFIRYFPIVSISELKGEMALENGNIYAEKCIFHDEKLVQFPTQKELVAAARGEAQTQKNWDCHAPYPIPELFGVMSLGNSGIGKFAFVGGIFGSILGIILTYGSQIIIYPTVMQGKPVNVESFWAFAPVIFELIILGALLGVLVGFLRLTRLPRWHHTLFQNYEFCRSAASDGFFLSRSQPLSSNEK